MGEETTEKRFRIFSHRNFALSLLAGVPLCLFLVWFVVGLAERKLAADMALTARDRLTLYSGTLYSALSKYSYLPHILASHPEIRRLVASGDNRDAVNRYLEDINNEAGAMALFVLDREGVTQAASNWNMAESFVGHVYNYRPYFQDAMQGGSGAYFGVGATTGNPGFFVTRQIKGEGGPLGVAITKVDLSMLQREWRSGGETVFIMDEHGVIFLASRDDWRYRATRPLTGAAGEAMLYQRQYGSTLPPPIRMDRTVERGVDILELDGSRWIGTTRPINEYGWTIWFLTPLTLLKQQRDTLWFIGGGATLVLLLLTLLARTYFAWTRARREAGQAEKIRAVNRQLAEEVRIRMETEQELLAAQGDLLHASRMAALGQVAASVAHELSQPVTSMRMFAASCRRLAEEGRHDKVAETIGHMAALVGRITALIDQLKHFSRKAPGRAGPVSLGVAIANALTVLQFRQEVADCIPAVDCPEDVFVMADALQVEQVIINLVQNALDAVTLLEDPAERRVFVRTGVTEGSVVLTVADNGPGIAPAVREQIFTPFFTTKKSGEGIGLGLALVDNIVRAMRGEIQVEDVEPQGTRFIVYLPRAASDGAMP